MAVSSVSSLEQSVSDTVALVTTAEAEEFSGETDVDEVDALELSMNSQDESMSPSELSFRMKKSEYPAPNEELVPPTM